jgi:predicted amidohydrolase
MERQGLKPFGSLGGKEMKLKVALAQMDIALGKPEANLEKALEMISQAKAQGSEMVVLPEIWSTGYDLEREEEYARVNEGIAEQLASAAREHSIYIIGSLIAMREGRYYNSATIFSPDGALVGRYDKAHLFPLLEEDRYFAPGQEMPLFDLPWGRTALAICYDLRFPELFRHYALAGAKMVFLPAEWPYPRLEHWRVLLRARAIENQYFVVACNRVGEGRGYRYFGHSAICDPGGVAIVEGGEEEALLWGEIDLASVEEARRIIPVFRDRREDLYGRVV